MSELHIAIKSVELSRRQVLHDIALEIDPGTFVGLLGPNGAGKTTFLRAILGLIPINGQVRLGRAQGRELRTVTGYVPQRHDVAWDFPVDIATCVLGGRTDMMSWRVSAADKAARDQALELVELSDLATRPIGELSGGQRQRVLVARALARKPQLLILDEPFTGVDRPTAEHLLKLCTTLARRGTTVVMSSHDLGETVAAAQRIVLLNRTLIAGDITTATPWQRAFGVGEDSPLLRTVGVR